MKRKDIESLLNAFSKLKDDIDASNKRRKDKQVIPITPPFSLKDALSYYTRDELHNIRRELQIERASSLKKAEISELLAEKLPYYLEQFLKITYDKHLKLLEKIYNNQGMMQADKIPYRQIEYLRGKGFIFYAIYNNEKVVTMPIEIYQHFATLSTNFQLKAKVRKNTEWINLTTGLLYYYGTLNVLKLQEMIEKYTKEKVNYIDFYNVITEKIDFEDDDYYDENGFSCGYVQNAALIKAAHYSRKDIDYYPFTKKQLLEAADDNFIESNTVSKQFVNFLIQNYDLPRIHAIEFVEELILDIKNGVEPTDIIKNELVERFEIPDETTLEMFINLIFNLNNHTRHWTLKGYAPVELVKEEKKFLRSFPENNDKVIDLNARRKVGRNDLCPCGSGKKYKKCCGK